MKKMILCLCVFTAATSAFADDNSSTDAVAQANSTLSTLTTKKDEILKRIKATENAQATLNKTAAQYSQALNDPKTSASQKESILTQLNSLSAAYADLDKNNQQNHAQLDQVQDHLNLLAQDAKYASASPVVRAQMRAAQLSADLTNADLKILHGQFNLQKLGSDMDREDIGKYMAAKMALFVNSDAFCREANYCAKGGGSLSDPATQHIKDNEIMSQVFPGGPQNLFKKVNFYDSQTHSGSQ